MSSRSFFLVPTVLAAAIAGASPLVPATLLPLAATAMAAADDIAPPKEAVKEAAKEVMPNGKTKEAEKALVEAVKAVVHPDGPEKPDGADKSPEELAREALKKEVESMNLELQKLTVEYQLM